MPGAGSSPPGTASSAAATAAASTWPLVLPGTTVALVSRVRRGLALRPPVVPQRLGVGNGGWSWRTGTLVLGLWVPPAEENDPSEELTLGRRGGTLSSRSKGSLTGTIQQGRQAWVSRYQRDTLSAKPAFRIDALTGDGRVSDSALQLRFGSGTMCEGTLTTLDDTGFTGTCRAPRRRHAHRGGRRGPSRTAPSAGTDRRTGCASA